MINCRTLDGIYNKQIEFQNLVKEKAPYDFEVGILPEDNHKGFAHHMLHLMSELGEVLNSDKRWKNYRNDKLDLENKKEEIADCFIILMNVAIYSGFNAKDVEDAICDKIGKNINRVKSL